MDIGVEVELADSKENRPTYRLPGENSEYVLNEHRDGLGNWHNATVTYDGTVGTEIVMPQPRDINDSPERWFDSVLNEAREAHGLTYEPCGLIDGGNSVGLHIHLSPLTDQQAQDLFRASQTDWMKVFACSSLTDDDHRVFRSTRYCDTDGGIYDGNRYTAVREVNSMEDHYEWRLPEPVDREHFELLMEYLRRFSKSPSDANEWAKGLVEDADDRLVSIKRANEIELLRDEDEDDFELLTISRSPNVQTDSFFWEVYDSSETPYIYRAYLDDEEYYCFNTSSYSPSREFEIGGESFTPRTVFDAETLKVVDDNGSLYERVNESIREAQSPQPNEPHETAATEKLRAVLR